MDRLWGRRGPGARGERPVCRGQGLGFSGGQGSVWGVGAVREAEVTGQAVTRCSKTLLFGGPFYLPADTVEAFNSKADHWDTRECAEPERTQSFPGQ